MDNQNFSVTLVASKYILLKYGNFQCIVDKVPFYFDTFDEFNKFLETSLYDIVHNEENYIVQFHFQISGKTIPLKFTLCQETKLTYLEKEVKKNKKINAKILRQLKDLELESIKGLDDKHFEIRIEKLKIDLCFENMRDYLLQHIHQHQIEIDNFKKEFYELHTAKKEYIKNLERENYDLRTQLSNIHTIEPSQSKK